MSPIVSVVMPTYNSEKYVGAALESILAELVDDIEVVVVDDGSSDQSVDIVHGFMNRMPLRLITPGRLGNWVAVTNIGLREATGEWACFLHGDDLWLPGKIRRLRAELDRAEGALVIHNSLFIGPDGQHLGPWTCPLPAGLIAPREFLEHLLVQNFIAISSPLFKRGTAEQWIKEGKQAVKMTRLSCHRFRSNEVRLWLSVIAYNLGNLWRRLVLPNRIDKWSLTSLQQRLVKTGGRLIKHARCYWVLLAEGHLTRRLFGAMLGRIAALSSPAG